MTGKTSTIIIHHGKCDPSKWTLDDWMVFERFVRTGSLQSAAAMARRGLQLVVSEHHVSAGGTLEHVGYAHSKGTEFSPDVSDVVNFDEDIEEVVPIYRGPSVYAVRYAVGEDDEVYGHEIEIKPTEHEAEAFLEALREPECTDA